MARPQVMIDLVIGIEMARIHPQVADGEHIVSNLRVLMLKFGTGYLLD